MTNERFYNDKKSLGLLFLSFSSLLFLLIIVLALLKPGISFDDYYTLGIVRFPFMDMITATAENVHPPLYYIILKVFCKVCGPLDNLNLVLVGKAVSLIPLGLLLILSFTKVKKEFGILTAGIFSFLLMSSFPIIYYATVIRMYSWALLFVTAELIFFYDIIHRKSNSTAWIVFTIASICSIYTHYFAAISTIIIYLILFAYLFHSNRKELKKWLISAMASFISYVPWIGILLGQISYVRNDYWIDPITFETFLSYIDFIFLDFSSVIGKVLEILLIVLLIALIYISLKNRKSRDDYVDFSLISISIIFLTIIIGIALSFLIRPIFISRYMLPCFGGLWLGMAILLAKCFDNRNNSKTSYDFDTRKIFYFGIVLILIISIFSAMNFYDHTLNDYEDTLDNYQFFDSINDGRVVIFDHPISYLRFSPYLDKDKCILDSDLNSIGKYKENDTVIFDKTNYRKLNKTDYQYKQIFEVYQDKVFIFD